MSKNASNRESLFIHLLTQFSMKFYYLCTWIRAPSRKSEKCAFTVIEWHNYRPYFGSKFATYWLSILFLHCIGKQICIPMINDDKTFYHKALVWSAFFVLGDRTICYCLSSLRNISSPYFTLNRKFGVTNLINDYCIIVTD